MAQGTQRERIIRAIEGTPEQAPAAFFLHFDSSSHRGPEAVRKHVELFESTGMDLSKVQLELPWPRVEIHTPDDWAHLPVLDDAFFAPELEVVSGVVRELGSQAPVVVTLYSPYMVAGEMGGYERLVADIQSDPSPVDEGLAKIAESLAGFVRACAARGADGIYCSTQGAEKHRFRELSTFLDHVKPHDLVAMLEADRTCKLNVLHICDYNEATYGGYGDFTPFLDYPGQIVSCNPEHLGPKGISESFGRPFLGGMDRLGALATGTEEEVRHAAREALATMPPRFILGANCTVPASTPWSNLRAAIDEAHTWSRRTA